MDEILSNQLLDKKFLTASDVAEVLGCSVSKAYMVIKELNSELKDQGKIVIAGKVSKRYFETKVEM